MKIITKVSNIDITDTVKEYLEKKLSSIEKFISEDTKVDVELKKTTNHHKSGDIYSVEVIIWHKGKITRASKSSEDIYASIDLAQDELFNALSNKKVRQ